MTTPRPDATVVAAYIDGELDAAGRAAFEAALAADPQLQNAVARERALRAALREAYDPVLQEPVPQALQAALQGPRTAQVVDLAAARARRLDEVAAAPPRRSWPQWVAMAACLVAGVLLGRVVPDVVVPGQAGGPPAGTPHVAADGLQAQGRLAQALDDRLAADTQPGDGVAVGLSFAARDGRYCRSFALTGGPGITAGLACRGPRHWQVVAAAPAPAAAPGSYRTAATALPPALLAVLDELRAGDTLDAAAERAARDRGWQR